MDSERKWFRRVSLPPHPSARYPKRKTPSPTAGRTSLLFNNFVITKLITPVEFTFRPGGGEGGGLVGRTRNPPRVKVGSQLVASRDSKKKKKTNASGMVQLTVSRY